MAEKEHPHFERFSDEYFHDSTSFGRKPFPRIRDLTRYDAYPYALIVRRDISREHGDADYAEYKRHLIKGVRHLHNLARNSPGALKLRGWPSPAGVPGLVRQAYEHLPRDRGFNEKLRDTSLNVSHVEEWLKRGVVDYGEFGVRPELFTHPESPMLLALYRAKGRGGERIATVGFHLIKRGRSTVLSINNIQGVHGKKADLQIFSEQVEKPWFLHLGEKLISYARERGFKVEGEHPWPFSLELAFDSIGARRRAEREHAKRINHYEQTYHNLGLKKVRGVWKLPK